MGQRDTRRQERRDAVLQAAMTVFTEKGFQPATMEEIARRAGVAKGTPYLYFADKADLFYAVFEKWTKDALAGSKAASAADSAVERLQALALSAADYMDIHWELFPLSLEVWAASGNPALRERFVQALSSLYAGYRSETAAIIRAGQASGELREDLDAQALATLLTGAVDGLFLQCWFDPALDARKLLSGFFDGLLHGLIKHGKRGRS